MNDMRNKIFSLLVLLMTAVSGAWADDYYLVGTMNDWGASKQFQLTQNPGNTDEYMITLTFKAGAEFKVIGVGESTTWYPAGDNYYVNDAGEYTVYFRPDGQGGSGWHYGYIYLAAAPAPAIPVTDLDNNTWQFTMPDYAVVANIKYDTDLELREENTNTTVLAEWDGYEADVTLTRTLQAGSWNTFAAPFSMDIPSGWTVKELTSATFADGTLTLNFATAASIVAGKPYLVKVTANTDLSKAPFTGAIVSKEAVTIPTDYADFIPTLGATTIEGSDTKAVLFLEANNTLLNPSALPANIKGFRAYFQLKGETASLARAFSIDFGDDDTTDDTIGIIAIGTDRAASTDNATYTLDGRRISKATQKGVYIQNGKKVIIRSATQGDACQSKK